MSGLKLSLCLCVASAAIVATPARAASDVIAQHSVLVPSYSTFNTVGNINLNVLDIWATDPRALLKQYYSYSSTERFLIQGNDGQPRRIALYFADHQNQGRSNTIQVLDTASGAVLDTRQLTDHNASERDRPGVLLGRRRHAAIAPRNG